MRGSPNKFKIFYPVLRIIPTGAGLTDAPQLDTKAFGDHPRGCGAHVIKCRRYEFIPGSSPRVRGSLARRARLTLQLGIIPAGAGLTTPAAKKRASAGDHPRGCGAHTALLVEMPAVLGSSPRVRGSLRNPLLVLSIIGIIPAGAGLTSCRCHWCCQCRNHPRGCGAHHNVFICHSPMAGSSPRVRGSRYGDFTITHGFGIIPAGAGLTSSRRIVVLRRRDHPRGCGAHTKKSQQLRHSLLLWLPESFTFKYSYRISHLVYSFVSAAT